MQLFDRTLDHDAAPDLDAAVPRVAPGKRTLTQAFQRRRGAAGTDAPAHVAHAAAPIQRRAIDPAAAFWFADAPVATGPAVQRTASANATDADLHAAAASGVAGGSATLPFLTQIQAAFGAHDVSGVQAHVGGAAAEASAAIGAQAYATGNHVAFAGAPDLHTAAHEAAHVVQQRAGVQLLGGIGEVGDRYEQHADEVAAHVVRGESAEALLDRYAPSRSPGTSATGSAIQRVASEYKHTSDIDGMTLCAFDEYAHAQADWATSTTIGTQKKAAFRRLLEVTRREQGLLMVGLGSYLVAVLDDADIGLGNPIDAQLRAYSRGCREAVKRTGQTVAIVGRAGTVERAAEWGEALLKLETAPGLGGPVISQIIPQGDGRAFLGFLVAQKAVDTFIQYIAEIKPILDARNGDEIRSFVATFGKVQDWLAFQGALPTVRNLHRFEHRTLERLAVCAGAPRGDLPLTVILQSAFDHSGSFHHDEKLFDVVQRQDRIAVVVEGAGTLADFAGHAETLAHRYKHDGKIDELLISGHGSFDAIELAGDKLPGQVAKHGGQKLRLENINERLIAAFERNPDAARELHTVLQTAVIPDKSPLDLDPARAAARVTRACVDDKSLGDVVIATLESMDTRDAAGSTHRQRIEYAIATYPRAAEAFHKILRSSSVLSLEAKVPFSGDAMKTLQRIVAAQAIDPNLDFLLNQAIAAMPAVDVPRQNRFDDKSARFVARMLDLMKDDPGSRIVLNACLTASNAVNQDLDPDPDVAAVQIDAAINKDPSLTFMLRQAIAARRGNGAQSQMQVEVRGANASGKARAGLLDDDGRIDLHDTDDPTLTSPDKLTYLEHGVEPTGVLRAAVETWAQARARNDGDWFDVVTRRLARTKDATEWNAVVIRTLLHIVVGGAQRGKDVTDAQLMNHLQRIAGDLAFLRHATFSRVSLLHGQLPTAHVGAIFGGLRAAADWVDPARWFAPLVCYQLWMAHDPMVKAGFLAELQASHFAGRKTGALAPYVDLDVVAGLLDAALMPPVAKHVPPGPFMLALLFVEAQGAAAPALAKAFLTNVVKDSGINRFPDAVNVGAYLTGDAQQVLISLGLAHAPMQGHAAQADDQPNVDLTHTGTNDFRVEPMTRRARTNREIEVSVKPNSWTGMGTIPRGTVVHVIGTTAPTNGTWSGPIEWFAIEHGDGKHHIGFVDQAGVTLL